MLIEIGKRIALPRLPNHASSFPAHSFPVGGFLIAAIGHVFKI
jgi:hypothetical protein